RLEFRLNEIRHSGGPSRCGALNFPFAESACAKVFPIADTDRHRKSERRIGDPPIQCLSANVAVWQHTPRRPQRVSIRRAPSKSRVELIHKSHSFASRLFGRIAGV